MCSPKVAHIVRERIEKEGKPTFSRRSLLRLGGVTAGAAALSSLMPAAARAQEATPEAAASGSVVDLTHVFGTDIPTYLVDEKPQRETFVSVEENGFYIQRWTFTEHASTHVDIPAHFIAGAETVDVYDAALLVSPIVVIDISERAAADPDTALSVADIEAYEAANGQIPAGAVVALYSGWDARWSDPIAFRNADADDVQHYPGFSPEAAAFLLTERDIHGIGVDTLSLDPGNSTTFDVHVAVLGAGKYGIEGLNNLAELIGRPATVFVGVPRWEAGSGGPARVLAVV
ncbi:MAG: cyclase family protein [bacterium]|nr:cyclase family protein [bacterium]